MVLLQVLNVPWSWKSLFVYGLQVIAALPGVMNNLVGSFSGWVEFPLDRVFSCWGDFVEDKVNIRKLLRNNQVSE